MRSRKRFGFSEVEKSKIWSRWKSGQSLHEIGRATLLSLLSGLQSTNGFFSGLGQQTQISHRKLAKEPKATFSDGQHKEWTRTSVPAHFCKEMPFARDST